MRYGIKLRSAIVAVLSLVLCGLVWLISPMERVGQAQDTPQGSAEKPAQKDDYQRSTEIFGYRTMAKSGPPRGEELYYFKCWFCHNQFQKTGPQLKDLFKRPTFSSSGYPVNDQTVTDKILKGGPGMPAFSTTLKQADIADLLNYIKEGCCFDSENPPPNPRYRTGRSVPASRLLKNEPVRSLLGGARGTVHAVGGAPIEGMGVQLVSARTAIRTTVYSDNEGKYEFPILEPGQYTLRISLPREYQPYVREAVRIDGATHLDDIVLTRISAGEFVPPTPETLSQLTGAEWMLNIPGSGEEKRVFTLACGFGCHSYQQVFGNRYDEASWRLILRRMFRGAGSPLINLANPTPTSLDRAHRPILEDEELLTKWLTRVRGPDSQDQPLYFLPRPRGVSTKVVITEYELPRLLIAPHDVSGDSKGNIWYTTHRTPYAGVLDPRTGIVKEYRIPGKDQDTPDALPGTHRAWVDKNDIVWFSENWDHYLTALDPRTGMIIKRFGFPETARLNSAGFSDFAMDNDGFVYESSGGKGLMKIDSKTGQIVQLFPFKKITSDTYDSIVTPDGKYWAGVTGNVIGLVDTKTSQTWELELGSELVANGARGGFDREGNAWFGGRGGMLIKVNSHTREVSEYIAPNPYDTFYEAMPDKNGEVWAGGLQSGHFNRFNPKTGRWIAYMMPEPFAHDRRTWIDNSRDPVTVWYVDQEGYLVRIQPLE